MRGALRFSVIAAVFAIVTSMLGVGPAFAYGRADQPIAQVEISANCNNPGFALCQEVGLGGVWTWAELDTAGGDGSSGDIDYTLAFCGHAGPGGGAHSAGGGGGRGEGVWWTVNNLGDALAAGGSPFFDTSKTYSSYYVLDFFPGSPPADDFIAVVPAAYGHYNGGALPPGVAIQTQVAP